MIVKIHPSCSGLTQFFQALPSTFASEGESLHQGRNQVKIMHWQGRDLVVKRYKKPNFFLKLQFTFLNNCKAKKAYKYGRIFQEKGFRTPQPAGYLIEGRWPIIRGSYFVCEPVQGQSLQDMLKVGDQALIDKLAAEVARMHKCGLMHGDLNLSNIYLTPDGQFEFIDTNRSKLRHNPSQKACANNIMRLSHDRELLTAISRAYAAQRGWDGEAFSALVIARLEAFERRKAFTRRLKSIF